jgi:hypothetical protein
MIKVIGTINPRELTKRNTRSRRAKKGGTLIGSAIITNIKGIPNVNFARCNIRRNKQGLYAVRNGIYIRPVSINIINDKSFKAV